MFLRFSFKSWRSLLNRIQVIKQGKRSAAKKSSTPNHTNFDENREMQPNFASYYVKVYVIGWPRNLYPITSWYTNLHVFVGTFTNAGKIYKWTWGCMIWLIIDYKLRPNEIILEKKKKEPQLFVSLCCFLHHVWQQSSTKLNSSLWHSEWIGL